jgi:hypothetical protein
MVKEGDDGLQHTHAAFGSGVTDRAAQDGIDAAQIVPGAVDAHQADVLSGTGIAKAVLVPGRTEIAHRADIDGADDHQHRTTHRRPVHLEMRRDWLPWLGKAVMVARRCQQHSGAIR